jgi:hypothetical protein
MVQHGTAQHSVCQQGSAQHDVRGLLSTGTKLQTGTGQYSMARPVQLSAPHAHTQCNAGDRYTLPVATLPQHHPCTPAYLITSNRLVLASSAQHSTAQHSTT